MKILAFISLIAITLPSVAEVPKRLSPSKYGMLSSNSPFTLKPEVEVEVEENPLGDYALGGISKLEDGFHAVLINKKKPNERLVIKDGKNEDGFEIVAVKWGEDSWRETTATVRKGSHMGVVSFDAELLKQRAATTAKNNAKAKAKQVKGKVTPPNQARKNAPKAANTGGKQTPRPRRRVVIPKK